MAKKLLLDTDVLVDYLRGYPPAERTALHTLISTFEVTSIDMGLAERGGLLRRDFAPKHGTGLADALIAATAQQTGAELVTLNAKHFPMLRNVTVPYKQ